MINKFLLGVVYVCLSIFLRKIPKGDRHIKSIIWLMKRHRAGFDKYNTSLRQYRHDNDIEDCNIKEATTRLCNYLNDHETRHLVDGCFYLLNEIDRKT